MIVDAAFFSCVASEIRKCMATLTVTLTLTWHQCGDTTTQWKQATVKNTNTALTITLLLLQRKPQQTNKYLHDTMTKTKTRGDNEKEGGRGTSQGKRVRKWMKITWLTMKMFRCHTVTVYFAQHLVCAFIFVMTCFRTSLPHIYDIYQSYKISFRYLTFIIPNGTKRK